MTKRRVISQQIIDTTERGYLRGAIPLNTVTDVLKNTAESQAAEIAAMREHFLDQERVYCAAGTRKF